MNAVVVDDADRTALGYACLWEVKLNGECFSIFLTHVIIWWSGRLRCPYHNMHALEWKLSTTTTDNIVLRFNELTKQKPVPFRIFVFILKGNTYYMTGTGQ